MVTLSKPLSAWWHLKYTDFVPKFTFPFFLLRFFLFFSISWPLFSMSPYAVTTININAKKKKKNWGKRECNCVSKITILFPLVRIITDSDPFAHSAFRMWPTKQLHWRRCPADDWNIFDVYCHIYKINRKTVFIWISTSPYKVSGRDAHTLFPQLNYYHCLRPFGTISTDDADRRSGGDRGRRCHSNEYYLFEFGGLEREFWDRRSYLYLFLFFSVVFSSYILVAMKWSAESNRE